MGNTITLPPPEYGHPMTIQPPDFCPHVAPSICVSEFKDGKCAENMTDSELVSHVEIRLRSVGKELRSIIPYLLEARRRYAHAGRRIPVAGQPSFTEWIHQTLGISDRHVRRLLAAARESTDCSPEGEWELSPKQQQRDATMWRACRIAHAILGLDEADDCDPSGRQRMAALAAMAHQFLHGVHRKPTAITVRAKPLQPADVRGLYGIILTCFEMQVDDVFRSLGDEERRDAMRLFTHHIADRYSARG